MCTNNHSFNQPAEQLASCGSQLQLTCGTICIMQTTTSIKLWNNWHPYMLSFPYKFQSWHCYHIWTFSNYFEWGFPMPSAKIRSPLTLLLLDQVFRSPQPNSSPILIMFLIHILSDQYAIQSIQYLIHMLSD